MTLTESIRYALSEGVLKWTTTDEDTGAQEAVMTDGSKFTLKSIGGELIVSYISKGGNRGNEIYHTPTNAPMAFMKAKQAAEKFIGTKKDTKHNTDDKENEHSENEELSHTRDIGTPTLTQQNKEATFDKEADIKHLQTLIDNPDEAFAKKNYGSIEAYKKMLQSKIDRLQKNEAVQGTEMVTLKSTDKLEVKYGSILVNGRPFEMTDPDESLDWPKSVTSDGKLVTWFKGDKESASEWEPSEISGYFSDVKKESHNESISLQKHIRMISLITEESDHDLIKKFLMENSIKCQENQLSYIRTAFKRFKKANG